MGNTLPSMQRTRNPSAYRVKSWKWPFGKVNPATVSPSTYAVRVQSTRPEFAVSPDKRRICCLWYTALLYRAFTATSLQISADFVR
jgi:hypothetical protein